MSQSKRNRTKIELGHDAFLDIVANLVGVLIILVVVLGTQSSQVINEIKAKTESELVIDEANRTASDAQLGELGQVTMRAAAAQADSDRLEATIKQCDQNIAQRQQQRSVMLDLLSEAKAAWDAEKERFDKKATEMASRNREFEETKDQLAQLQGERERLEGEKQPVVAITHLPTPMAKTVFGDEIHFRLKANRLSVVPIERLIAEIKNDFERAAGGSRDGLVEAAVGPVRGYVARYEMAKSREMVSRGGQVGLATRISLVGMSVAPLNEPIGTPIQTMFQKGSDLDIELAGRDAATTTITVWVYPDSFAAFRHLKEHLYARGFAAAARPLPMDREITGGPQGSRSVAQ
ncbi:Ribonuclease Y [Planctomycetes bacterium CA13]|uniref:Ribonuclease Y n=1 Tax=Novipirellula herctigrandis TaxID=2527986 RepID=A0A5C5Z7W3_9BACT|nr:Ribonuclease Y [Planctomycetes bacterium CA13]